MVARGICTVETKVEIPYGSGDIVTMKCCAEADFYVQEDCNDGSNVYYLCESHRKEILPFCNRNSVIRISPIGPKW